MQHPEETPLETGLSCSIFQIDLLTLPACVAQCYTLNMERNHTFPTTVGRMLRSNPKKARQKIYAAAALPEVRTVTALAKHFGVTRKTVHVWLNVLDIDKTALHEVLKGQG